MRLITRAVTLRAPRPSLSNNETKYSTTTTGTISACVSTHRIAREHCPWCRRQPQPKQRVELPRTTLPTPHNSQRIDCQS